MTARRLLLSLTAALLTGAALAAGAEADVPVQADCSNFGTMLAAAVNGETIVLTGLCTDQSHPLPAVQNLTIEGAATGINGFDGNGAAAPALSSTGSTTNGLTLRNLVFENYDSAGVSVHYTTSNFSSPYAFIGDTFSNNTAAAGNGAGLDLQVNVPAAGVCPSGPNITVSGSTFTGNSTPGGSATAGGGGGGAFLNLECNGSPSIEVTGNTFTGNTVAAASTNNRNGGGLWVGVGPTGAHAQVSLTQSGNLFSGNSITGAGGSYFGGGEFTLGANLTSSGDRFIDNSLAAASTGTARSEGGGLSTRDGGSCLTSPGNTSTATNLVAAGNTIGAPPVTGNIGEGAGIYAGCTVGSGGYDLTLINSTVSGNQVGGGGVAGIDGEATDVLTLRNTIVKGNLGGGDLDGFGASPGANVTANNSDVCAIGGATPFTGAGNICADPALVGPGPGSGDVHETAASPTIDVGSNGFIGATPTDVFGSPRIVPGRLGDAAIVDIGAAEFPTPAAAPSNVFTVGKVKGKKLFVDVASAGRVDVTQAGAGGSTAVASAKKLLKPSSASGGPGTVVVPLALTKKAKKKLQEKGKLKLNATVTFTPTGGTSSSKAASLKIKSKKKP